MATQWKMSSYMKGAAMLTIAALVVKVLSAVYRVPFQNMVGDEGFYIYQQIYPFIGMITTWTSVGFAMALAKLLSEYTARGDTESVQKVKRVGFFYISAISLVFFLLLAMGAPFLAEAMGDPRLSRLIQVGAVVILAMPFLALLKSIYQSTERLAPLAYAQVVEQAVRVGFILIGAYIVLSFTGDLYATGSVALLGATVGEVAGILLLGYWLTANERRVWKRSTSSVSTRSIIRELTVISISASISSLFFLMLQLVDSMTVLNTLVASGTPLQEAKETKGIYDRVQPLVQMGIVVTTSLAFALVPLIASKMQQQSGRGAMPFIRLSYRVALVFGSAAALGLVVTMPYVNEMLFQTRDLSSVLMIGSVQVVWLSLLLLFMSILQGAGRIWRPTAWLAVGVLVKVLTNLWFVREFGILGAALSGNVAMVIALLGVTFELKRTWRDALAPLSFYFRLGGALLAMAIAVTGFAIFADAVILDTLPSRIQAMVIALVGVGIGISVFLSLLMKLQLLQPKEWYLLPFGRRFARLQLWVTRKKG